MKTEEKSDPAIGLPIAPMEESPEHFNINPKTTRGPLLNMTPLGMTKEIQPIAPVDPGADLLPTAPPPPPPPKKRDWDLTRVSVVLFAFIVLETLIDWLRRR